MVLLFYCWHYGLKGFSYSFKFQKIRIVCRSFQNDPNYELGYFKPFKTMVFLWSFLVDIWCRILISYFKNNMYLPPAFWLVVSDSENFSVSENWLYLNDVFKNMCFFFLWGQWRIDKVWNLVSTLAEISILYTIYRKIHVIMVLLLFMNNGTKQY